MDQQLNFKTDLDQIMQALHQVTGFKGGISLTVHTTCKSFEEATKDYCDLAMCFHHDNSIHLLGHLFDPEILQRYNEERNTKATPLEVVAHEMLHLIRGDSDHGPEFQTQLFSIVAEAEQVIAA